MLVADWSDRFIDNYCHSLQCSRIWIPIMFQLIDPIWVYAYIDYNSLVEEEEMLEQKYFVVAMVDKLLETPTTLRCSSTRSVHKKRLKEMNRTLSTIGGGG